MKKITFRYADALLMKAEAKVRNGEEAAFELNQIRSRVGMPNRAATLENILEERLLELVWEGWRRQDMIRFGKYQSTWWAKKKATADNKVLLPIPLEIINANPNLVQNEGYK